jgi:hypothetical protein
MVARQAPKDATRPWRARVRTPVSRPCSIVLALRAWPDVAEHDLALRRSRLRFSRLE